MASLATLLLQTSRLGTLLIGVHYARWLLVVFDCLKFLHPSLKVLPEPFEGFTVLT